MITIISPAKTFNELPEEKMTSYKALLFEEETRTLVEHLQGYGVQELQELMKMSEALAIVNHTRYKEFYTPEAQQAYEAIHYFYGEAYKGIESRTMTENALAFAHEHVCILSGLYGIIRPLDAILAYRLEMGTRLAHATGKELYSYWKDCLTTNILEALAHTTGDQILINLASDEYSKALNLREIDKKYGVVTISFKENKEGKYKVVGMYAKKARGKMVRYLAENNINKIEQIKQFKGEGYQLNPILSDEKHLVFTR